VRSLFPVVVVVVVLVGQSFAQPAAVTSSLFPEPGVLALLGGGLVGLAAWIRSRFTS